MRLTDFLDDWDGNSDTESRRRQLAEDKSYEILDHLDLEDRFEPVQKGDALFGSRSPSIFVGRGNYPYVSTGILSPVGDEGDASRYATNGEWYQRGLDVSNVLQYRTGLLNSRRTAEVDVHDVWDGFVGTQREVAMADEPVDLEIGLNDRPNVDVGLDDVASPTGPDVEAGSAKLAENPSIPRAVEKTLEDDDWNAGGAMWYLYEKGFDVYDINQILSAGALGEADNRRLVPTRWSITAVDDTLGKRIRDEIETNQSVDAVEVYANEYMGNVYWVLLAPGRWEFELVEMKEPGSVWNPNRASTYLASAYEDATGRTGYVEETAGAYYAARLGVLEHLRDRGRQAKALVLREVTDDYWAPVGVWQVRESVRSAFSGGSGTADSFHGAIKDVCDRLPVSYDRLRRKSELAAGVQSELSEFGV